MIFVSSIVDHKWAFYEAYLFLKSFRKIYKKEKIYIFYDKKDIKVELLLKKYRCVIIKNLELSDYYSVKPILLKKISTKHKKNNICWIDIDSVFLKKIPEKEFYLYPKNPSKYMLNNNNYIKDISKFFNIRINFHTTSAIFVFNHNLINLYYNKYIELKKELNNFNKIKKKILFNKIDEDFLINHLEELSFCYVVNNNRINKSNQMYPEPYLGYYGKSAKRISIYCHDHYKIENINFLIPSILKSKNYINYRLKENTGE